MIVKSIFKNKDFNYFRDSKTQQKIFCGEIFECSDELAKEYIKKGYVVEATEKEKRAYVDNLDTIDEDDLKDKEETKENKN